jgi:hypothetical protein
MRKEGQHRRISQIVTELAVFSIGERALDGVRPFFLDLQGSICFPGCLIH